MKNLLHFTFLNFRFSRPSSMKVIVSSNFLWPSVMGILTFLKPGLLMRCLMSWAMSRCRSETGCSCCYICWAYNWDFDLFSWPRGMSIRFGWTPDLWSCKFCRRLKICSCCLPWISYVRLIMASSSLMPLISWNVSDCNKTSWFVSEIALSARDTGTCLTFE